MRIPSLPIPKGTILLISTCLVLQRIQLHFLVSLPESRIELLLRHLIGVLGGADPLLRLI